MRHLFFLAAVVLSTGALAGEVPRLGLPIVCALGTDCAVQNYLDTDPGPGWTDYSCGAMSYDGHAGTDFRIADRDMLKAGIPVVAAAAGTVLRTRDGMADAGNGAMGPDIPDGAACGNGVLIDLGEGWVTQYCHMRNGSIAVHSGDRVEAGAFLGYVGQSGQAEFPHVHLGVRHRGVAVDPFTGKTQAQESAGGRTCGAAGAIGGGLWSNDVARLLAYRAPMVLNTGFAAGRIDMEDIDSRERTILRLTPETPALVFYGRAIGLSAGERQRIVITTPDGSVFVENATEPEKRARAQVMAFAGKKRPPEGWRAGAYTARYQVLRNGRVVAEHGGEIALVRP